MVHQMYPEALQRPWLENVELNYKRTTSTKTEKTGHSNYLDFKRFIHIFFENK